MHLGTIHTIGYLKNKNFKHIILNNNSHESVGGQPTYAKDIDFKKISIGLGYRNFFKINGKKEVNKTISNFLKRSGPSLLEVKIQSKSLKNLIRPKYLEQIKNNFMGSQ